MTAKTLFHLLKILTTGVALSSNSKEFSEVHEAVKTIGINCGTDSFKIGVRKRRKRSEAEGLEKEPVIEKELDNLNEIVIEDDLESHEPETDQEMINMKVESDANDRDHKSKIQLNEEDNVIKECFSYSCAECGKTFNSKEKLRRHAVVHSGLKPFQCLDCEKYFSRKDKLREHVKRMH